MKYRTLSEWTFEQAQEEQREFASGLPSNLSPIHIWSAFRDLELLEDEYKKTDNGFTVLAAVRKCANHDLVMPDWLVKAFIKRYDTVLNCRAESWDTVFNRPYKKGLHLSALRRKRMSEFQVFLEICRTIENDPSIAISKSLFEEVGKKFNLGTTLAEEYYRSAVKKVGFSPSKTKYKSRK